jgi:hypothetical protein
VTFKRIFIKSKVEDYKQTFGSMVVVLDLCQINSKAFSYQKTKTALQKQMKK